MQRDRKRINKQQTITLKEARAEAYFNKRKTLIPSHFLSGNFTATIKNYQNRLGA